MDPVSGKIIPAVVCFATCSFT